MYIHPKLKLNTFQEVAIPRPSEFFRKIGQNGTLPLPGSFSGDEELPPPMTKTQQLKYAEMVELEHLRDEKLAAEAKEKE